MTTVVDASVAVKWLIEEVGSTEAMALLRSGEELIAPSLIVAEATNTAWKKLRRGEITREHAELLAILLPRLFSHLTDLAPLAPRALAISDKLDHPAYDAFYLALAEEQDRHLVTDDARLLRVVAGTPWEPRVSALREPDASAQGRSLQDGDR